MNQPHAAVCDEDVMRQLLAIAAEDAERGVAAIDSSLTDCPNDPRLHFLRGSLLIGLKRFIAAHQALRRAIEIAPDYDLARFQLGFFELTSGEADAAIATWKPLHALPQAHWLRSFVMGLEDLAADRFDQCIVNLRAGIAVNQENLPLNGDMELIIERCLDVMASRAETTAGAKQEVSATSLLLGAPIGRRDN